jgi:outer membrane biosynthesis protein TonB
VAFGLSVPARVSGTLLSPAGHKLRTAKDRFAAGRHSLQFTLPVASLPPGRYTIRLEAVGADGTKDVERTTVALAAPAPKAQPTVTPRVVAPPVAPPPAPVTPAPSKPAPRPVTHTPPPPPAPQVKPKPAHKPAAKVKPLETSGSGYSGSNSHRTAGLAVAILGLGAGLALLLKVELSRILASPRR